MTFPINKLIEFLIIHYDPTWKAFHYVQIFTCLQLKRNSPLAYKVYLVIWILLTHYVLAGRQGFNWTCVALYLQRQLIYLKNILQKTLTKMHIANKEKKTLCSCSSTCILKQNTEEVLVSILWGQYWGNSYANNLSIYSGNLYRLSNRTQRICPWNWSKLETLPE